MCFSLSGFWFLDFKVGILSQLFAQVRREKISERMKYLQDLVPGCNKITGKAGMLDEIINYVQSLQRQVEVRASGAFPLFLSH